MRKFLGLILIIIGIVGGFSVVVWSFVEIITTISELLNGQDVNLFWAIVFFVLRDILGAIVALIFIGIGGLVLKGNVNKNTNKNTVTYNLKFWKNGK